MLPKRAVRSFDLLLTVVPRYWRVLAAFFVLLVFSTQGASAQDKWLPQIDFDARFETDRSMGGATLFIPLLQNDNTLLFSVLRGTFTDAPTEEGNFGVGIRHMFDHAFGEGIVGLYGFYDVRNSPNDNFFDQFTIGGEILLENFEARANAYLSQDRSYVIGTGTASTASLSGTIVQSTTVTTDITEIALPGFDVEAGVRFDVLPQYWGHAVNFGLFGGYFDFERDGVEMAGPMARANLTLNDPFGWMGPELTVGGEWREDDVRGEEFAGFARLRIPMGSAYDSEGDAMSGHSIMRRRATQRVMRDPDIIDTSVDVPVGTEVANLEDADSGQTINAYFVSQTGGGTECTQANPCTLSQATGESGDGDVLVLLDAGGVITTGSTVTLANNEQVIGGGDTGDATVTLSDANNLPLMLSGLGGRSTLNGTGDFGVITAADGNTVDGIGITGGHTGVFSSDADDLTVNDTTISGMTHSGLNANGIYLQSGSNLTVSNSMISNINTGGSSTVMGIRADSTNGVTVSDVTIDGLTSLGTGSNFWAIGMNGTGSSDISLTDVTIQNLNSQNNAAGINFDNLAGTDLMATRLTIQNVTGNTDGSDAAANSNQAFGARLAGTGTFNFDTLMIDDVQSTNANDNLDGVGIFLNGTSGPVMLANSTIEDTSSYGLFSDGSSGDLTINQGSSFIDNGDGGDGWRSALFIEDQGASTITLQDSTIHEASYFGLYALNPTAGPHTVNFNIVGNTFSDLGQNDPGNYGTAVYLDGDEANFTALIDNNEMTGVKQGVVAFNRPGGGGTTNVTITNNTISTRGVSAGTGSTDDKPILINVQDGTTCANIDGNTLTNDKTIQLHNTLADTAMSIEQFTDLSARNDTASVEITSGGVTNVATGTCLLP